MSLNDQIIQIFNANANGYVSGEQLSRALNVSRTAVWKHIQELRNKGYTFEAAPRLGYRLMAAPDLWDVQALLTQLQTRQLGKQVYVFDTLDSTQNKAHELVKQGASEGTLVIADQQTMGRGRMGRVWHSPKGKGIWMSLVLQPQISVQFIPQFTLLIAVAMFRAIRKAVPDVDIGIKWPNDLLIKGKKVCGILLESSATDESLNYVVAGVGISANLTAEDFSEELHTIGTSLLMETGKPVDRVQLVAEWLRQVEDLYDLYMLQGFAPIRTLWEASNVTLGTRVRVQSAKGFTEGEAIGLEESGALRVKQTDGEIVTVYSGHLNG